MSQGKVDIGFKADVADLKNKLAAISGITDKEAKAMVTSLQRAYSASERAAKKSAKEQKAAFESFKTTWTELSSKIGLLKTAYSTIVAPVLGFASAQAQTINELTNLSAKSQISITNIEAMAIAFESAGLTLENLDSIVENFASKMADAAISGGEAANIFKLIGVELRNTDGTIRDVNSVFEDTIEKIGEIKSPTEQGAAAMRLLGDQGSKLMQAFGGNLENFKAFQTYAEKFGLDTGPEAANAASHWRQATHNLSASFKIAGTTLFAAFGDKAATIIDLFVIGATFNFKFLEFVVRDRITKIMEIITSAKDVFDNLQNGIIDVDGALNVLQSGFSFATDFSYLKEAGVYADEAANAVRGLMAAQKNIGKEAKSEGRQVGSLIKNNIDNVLEELSIEPLVLTIEDIGMDLEIERLQDLYGVYKDLQGISSEYKSKSASAEDNVRANLDKTLQEIERLKTAGLNRATTAEEAAKVESDAQDAKTAAIADADNQISKIQKERFKDFVKDAKFAYQKVSGFVTGAMGFVDNLLGKLGAGSISSLFDFATLSDLQAQQDDLIKAAKETGAAIPTLKELAAQSIKDQVQGMVDQIKFMVEMAPVFLDAIIDGLPVVFETLIAAIPDLIQVLADKLPDLILILVKNIPDVIVALIENIPILIKAIVMALPEILKELAKGMLQVAKALVVETVKLLIDGIVFVAKKFWEALKDFFIPSELFDKDKNTTTRLGDTLREIFTLGRADTNAYNDTPGVIRAGASGAQMRFAAGDYVAAAKTPKDLLKQAMTATGAKEAVASSSGSAFVDWSHGAFAYDSFSRRLAGKKGRVLRQIYGAVA